MSVDQIVMGEILDIEWEMFHAVQGIDGPASCQQDRKTFSIMRSGQLAAWDQATAESYLDDLEKAKAAGRNLMTEKYAHMMQYTSPCEYRRIEGSVPAVEGEAAPIIERLTERSVQWMEEIATTYPYVSAQGRAIRNSGDTAYAPSFETYIRGELSTYSVRTLRLLDDRYTQLEAEGENPAEVILSETVAQYGYSSLERAEAAQRARAEQMGRGA